MQRSRPRFRTNNLQEAASRTLKDIFANWQLLLLLALFTIGMVCGAALLQNESFPYTQQIVTIAENYREAKETLALFTTFCNALLSACVYILVAYFSGLCALGIPFTLAVPFIKGLGLGVISGYFYSTFALKGLGYCLLLVYPGAFFTVLCILICCNESLYSARDLFHIAATGQTPESWGGIRLFSIRYSILVLLSVLGAVLDAVLFRVFSDFFTF